MELPQLATKELWRLPWDQLISCITQITNANTNQLCLTFAILLWIKLVGIFHNSLWMSLKTLPKIHSNWVSRFLISINFLTTKWTSARLIKNTLMNSVTWWMTLALWFQPS
jgi:hypothetical protein